MAAADLEDRLQKINNLKNYINSVEERVRAIAGELNWSYESLTEGVESLTVPCSVHPEHKVHNSRIGEHEEKCQWLKDGYREDDLPFPEDHGQGSCVIFTPEIQETVIRNSCSKGCQSPGEGKIRGIPQTSARLDQDFTREEKLALYDYVIANTKGQKIYKEIASVSVKEDKTKEKVMTPLEIAAAERDAKRRRASYRNKVHTNRKTQTEILREVIDSQMETLKEQIPDTGSKEKDCNSPHGIESDNRSPRREHSRQGYSRHGRDKFHKKSHDDKDHGRHHSSKESKHRNDYERWESKHKSKKHKRSRSRSHERSKLKKSNHKN